MPQDRPQSHCPRHATDRAVVVIQGEPSASSPCHLPQLGARPGGLTLADSACPASVPAASTVPAQKAVSAVSTLREAATRLGARAARCARYGTWRQRNDCVDRTFCDDPRGLGWGRGTLVSELGCPDVTSSGSPALTPLDCHRGLLGEDLGSRRACPVCRVNRSPPAASSSQ